MLITDKDTPHRTLRRFIFCGRYKKGAQEISPAPLLNRSRVRYIIGRTMSTLSPSASMMRKNIPTPGSISPFSMREM